MLFLLPPSETKALGGEVQTDSVFRFAELNQAREQIRVALNEVEASIMVMPAIDRYTGTLYSAVHGRGLKGTPTANNSLNAAERSRAAEMILIQSARYGLLSASDEIPVYKLNPAKLVNGLNLKKMWNQAHSDVWSKLEDHVIIDLRSKAYADLAELPEASNVFSVTVFVEKEDGSLEQLNHFNKKAKGQLVRAALMSNKPPTTVKELASAANKNGLRLEINRQSLTLVTRQAT